MSSAFLITAMNAPMTLADPLATARLYLRFNPNTEENCALRKLLQSLVNLDGTLHQPESILFHGELGELTAALLDARMEGRYSNDQWREAQLF